MIRNCAKCDIEYTTRELDTTSGTLNITVDDATLGKHRRTIHLCGSCAHRVEAFIESSY